MSKAAPVIKWMVKDGRLTAHNMRDFGDRFCEHIVAARMVQSYPILL
ncbi:MAG: hypothetical protein GKS02_07680 [Alphaproteobacteria bacterium]|nr:hypothetical protein [Alphaproteobacteria bacterium]